MKNLGLALAGLCLGGLLIEGGLRAAARWAAPAAPPPRPAGAPFVILCLGESTTGPTFGRDHSWPLQLGRLLNAGSGAPAVLVVNKGVPATNTAAIEAALPGYLDEFKPDLVIAMMGINDRRWFGLAESKTRWRWRTAKVLRYVYYEVLGRPFLGDVAAESVAHRRRIAGLIRARGIPLIMMQYPTLDARELERLFEGDPGISFVENKGAFERALARGRYSDYFVDRFGVTWGHCTEKGDRLLAEAAARAARAALRSLPVPGGSEKERALAAADRAASAEPSLRSYHQCALAHLKWGDKTGAEWWLDRALGLDPALPGPLNLMLELRRDRPREALAYAEKAARAAAGGPADEKANAEKELALARSWLAE